MFVTVPEFREAAMTAMAGNGNTYWRAVVADFPVLPWYLFVYKAQDPETRVNQVMLIAWEENLADFIDSVPEQDRGAVYRVDADPSCGLTIRHVRALWRASPLGNAEGLMALLALEGEGDAALDSFLRPVCLEHVGELVYKAPNGAASG